MKRILCIILALGMLTGTMAFAVAEEDDDIQFSDEELREMQEEEDQAENYVEAEVKGEVYHEMTREDFNANSPALYKAKMRSDYNGVIYSEKWKSEEDITPKMRLMDARGKKVDILYVGLIWFIVRRDNVIGYVRRQQIAKGDIETVDPVNTPTPSKGDGDDGNNWVILKPGTELSTWKFYKGWAMVNYWREYGYIDPNELTDLVPVSPTDEELFPDSPIAAYTSYYKMTQNETNLNRIHNIKTGCGYISQVLQPGERLDANKTMGPYRPGKGYKQAGVLTAGTSKLGYGGGTCQVSSTLYNALIQLPDIEINHRRPHGGNGAAYLPIHCDAAVGNPELNLIFTNRYDFPIKVLGTSNDDGALLMRIYRYHGEEE